VFLNARGFKSSRFNPWSIVWVSTFLRTSIILTWLGACPVEDPYLACRQIWAFVYFLSFFLFTFPIQRLWRIENKDR
jgi:quinol-cytochrome oxidoreductase complex cytochrome b subunit